MKISKQENCIDFPPDKFSTFYVFLNKKVLTITEVVKFPVLYINIPKRLIIIAKNCE
jgi:hypothetical protein